MVRIENSPDISLPIITSPLVMYSEFVLAYHQILKLVGKWPTGILKGYSNNSNTTHGNNTTSMVIQKKPSCNFST